MKGALTKGILGLVLVPELVSLVSGCSSSNESNGVSTGISSGGASGTGGASSTGSASGNGGGNAGGSAGSSANGGASGTGGNGAGSGSGTGGVTSNGGVSGTGGGTGSGTWSAGSTTRSCQAGVPAEGQPADTSNPTTVVGTGTADSCTFDALNAAVGNGGIITFDCGAAPVTIPVTSTISVPSDRDTVIDGGRLVTLDGQSSVQILNFTSGNWKFNDHRLTLQHLALINGKTTPTDVIPTRPAPCSQGYNDGQGGALFMRDGQLTVVDCIFTGNQGAPLGPDTGGGAIYVEGSKNGAVISGSTFMNNSASNGGAFGGLFCELHVYNSLFTQNTATGHDANDNKAALCPYMNNGQNEIGSGGNGGALYSDGAQGASVILCGVEDLNNAAGVNAFGGGLFFTSNDFSGDLSITDTTMTGNTGGSWTNVATGSITYIGDGVGTNCHSISVQNSTIQGYP